ARGVPGSGDLAMTGVRVAASRTKWVVTRTVLGWHGDAPVTAFVHIPKTAGGTVVTMLESAYSAGEVGNAGNYLRWPDTTQAVLMRARWTGAWRGARVVAGHIPYGLFRRTLPRDTRYVTF